MGWGEGFEEGRESDGCREEGRGRARWGIRGDGRP